MSGGDEVDALLEQLRHPWDEMSWAAARDLASRGERRAVAPLLAILDECLQAPGAVAEDRRCWGAAHALGVLREPSAFGPLVQLLRESTGSARRVAATALGALGDPRGNDALTEALAGAADDGGFRHAVALALAQLRDARAIPLLLADLTDADQMNTARWAADALGGMGEAALPALLAAQADPDERVRAWTTFALGVMGEARSVEPLMRRLADPSSHVRWQAVAALGDLGDRRAVPALAALQEDPEREVRKLVASALRRLGARAGPPTPEPRPGRRILSLYADYHQFYLGDSTFDGDTGAAEFWSPEAFARMLAVAPPGLLGVGTARYDWVPVVVDQLATAPSDDDLDAWDHIVEASLEVPSGRVAIDGCMSYRSAESPHIEVAPGTYRVRVYYGGLDTHDEDHYRIVLWPLRPYNAPRVIKQRLEVE